MNEELKSIIDEYIKNYTDQEKVHQYFALKKQIEDSIELKTLKDELKRSQKELALSINDGELHKQKLKVYLNEKEEYENHPLICNFKLIEDDIFNDFINLKDELD